jgi:CRP/FNR family transcriptional regulator, anaerobic regulatory protein
MTDILQYFNKLSQLDPLATDDFLKNLKVKKFKKGDYLLNQGDICKNLFFINEGLTKIFFYRDDKEFIMRFCHENLMFSVFESYLTQTHSNYAIMALETTTVTTLNYDSMELLCKKHHCIETFFRKLISIATVKMTRRISEMLEKNASESYNQFISENNKILQRINLGDLAKYLGITQQSLSRIRTQK